MDADGFCQLLNDVTDTMLAHGYIMVHCSLNLAQTHGCPSVPGTFYTSAYLSDPKIGSQSYNELERKYRRSFTISRKDGESWVSFADRVKAQAASFKSAKNEVREAMLATLAEQLELSKETNLETVFGGVIREAMDKLSKNIIEDKTHEH